MALVFRIDRTKKSPRVTVYRNQREGKKTVLEHLGSFGKGRPFDHSKANLTDLELYKLQNYEAAMNFGEEVFDCPVDSLSRALFKMPPQLEEALYKIWLEAKKHNIEFLPDKEMLQAVLERAQNVEKELKDLTDGQFSVLNK